MVLAPFSGMSAKLQKLAAVAYATATRLTVLGENKCLTAVLLEQAVIITSIEFDYLEDLITAQEG